MNTYTILGLITVGVVFLFMLLVALRNAKKMKDENDDIYEDEYLKRNE